MRCKINEGRQRWRSWMWCEWLSALSCFWSWGWSLEMYIWLTEWLSHLFVWHDNILFIPELPYCICKWYTVVKVCQSLGMFSMCYDTGLMKKFCLLPLCFLSPLPRRWMFEIHQYLVQGSSYALNKLILLSNVEAFSLSLKGKREVLYSFYYKPSLRHISPVIWRYCRNVNVMLLLCR